MAVANTSDMGEIILASAQRAPWGWALLASVVLALVKGWPVLTRIANERETGLLSQRAADMDKMSEKIAVLEARIEKQRADYEAQLGIHRHRANNIAACLDALLLMLELRPDRVPDAVARIKQMRAEQTVAEASEKGAVAGARIVAAGPDAAA